MKKYLCLILSVIFIFLLASCNSGKQFTMLDNGNIVIPDGIEYVHIANEGFVGTFGSHTFLGKIKGEKSTLGHMGLKTKTGMYSCEGDSDLNILMRVIPDNEWMAYYRKASLPEIDLSPDKCIRFEFIGYREINDGANFSPDIEHLTCNDGIKGQTEIQTFLNDVRSQKSPDEADLYDLIKKPDGFLENCYEYGIVYGYYEDELNLIVPLRVTSYNDKAYSISFIDKSYVLPEKWLDELKTK